MSANPWRHLGSLAFLFFVVCVASGVYAYAVFDTSLAGAYESGRALTGDAVLGRGVRGLHRYSADAFMLFTALHLLREAARGHFRHFRAWSWLSGALLVPLAWIAGLTGFWLAWDERALFSAARTAEWLAVAPVGLAGFVRNFLQPGAVNDRFFSLAVFVHIGVPLAALALTWAHLARLSHVRAWPPGVLGVPAVAALVALAYALPAASLGPAAALVEPQAIAIDWFFHFPHAIAGAITPGGLWIAVGLATLVLAGLPWLPGGRRAAPVVVDLGNCNGCARCAADCPFGAVVMVPRSDGRAHPREAFVLSDQCAACGICAGACPSATPFRRRTPVASGIDLPWRTVATLRAELDRALAAKGPVVFACRPGGLAPAGAIGVECAAMVPPSFIEYALRAGAPEVVIAACRQGDCEYRVGERWTRERIARERQPALRSVVPRERVRVITGEPTR